MRKSTWLLLVVGVFAVGVLATGCGGDDSTSSETAVTAPTTDTAATSEDTSSDSGVDTEEFLAKCQDAVAGTPAEEAGNQICQQAADALEQCAGQANDDAAIEICQQAADEAVKQLEASAG